MFSDEAVECKKKKLVNQKSVRSKTGIEYNLFRAVIKRSKLQ